MQEPATHLARRSGGETWCGLPASGVTLAGHGDPWKPVGRLCSDCEAAKLALSVSHDLWHNYSRKVVFSVNSPTPTAAKEGEPSRLSHPGCMGLGLRANGADYACFTPTSQQLRKNRRNLYGQITILKVTQPVNGMCLVGLRQAPAGGAAGQPDGGASRLVPWQAYRKARKRKQAGRLR